MTTLAQSILTRLVADPRGCVTVSEMLFDGYAENEKQLHNVLDTLERRIFIVKAAPRGCYEPSVDGRAWIAAGLEIQPGQAPKPRQKAGGIPAAAWAWLRIHRKGRVEDMLASIATHDQKAAGATLRRYLAALEGASYVQRIHRGRGAGRYLLVSDTGRHAPVHRRGTCTVYDPNLRSEIAINPDLEVAELEKTQAETPAPQEAAHV